jgi:ribonuclease P protein component
MLVTPYKLVTLLRRAEFLRIRGGGRAATPRFVMEGKARTAEPSLSGGLSAGPRFGFTVTKQMGNAVVRKRIKRRLRAAIVETAPKLSATNYDYVIIARPDAHACDFKLLIADFISGFPRVNRGPSASKPRKEKPSHQS